MLFKDYKKYKNPVLMLLLIKAILKLILVVIIPWELEEM